MEREGETGQGAAQEQTAPTEQDEISDPISVREAAEILGVHANTVRNRIARGTYRHRRVLGQFGPEVEVSRAEVEKDRPQPRHPTTSPTPSQALETVTTGTTDTALMPVARIEQALCAFSQEQGRQSQEQARQAEDLIALRADMATVRAAQERTEARRRRSLLRRLWGAWINE